MLLELLLDLHSIIFKELLRRRRAAGINDLVVYLVHVIRQLGHPVEADVATCHRALIPFLVEVPALVLVAVSTRAESTIAVLALVGLLARMTPHVQFQVGNASEFAAAYLLLLCRIIFVSLYRPIFIWIQRTSAAIRRFDLLIRLNGHYATDLGSVNKKLGHKNWNYFCERWLSFSLNC